MAADIIDWAVLRAEVDYESAVKTPATPLSTHDDEFHDSLCDSNESDQQPIQPDLIVRVELLFHLQLIIIHLPLMMYHMLVMEKTK